MESRRYRYIGRSLVLGVFIFAAGFLASEALDNRQQPAAPAIEPSAAPSGAVGAAATAEQPHHPSMEPQAPSSAALAKSAPSTAMAPLPELKNAFVYGFNGAPDQPQPWHPADWDITVHTRDQAYWETLEPIDAHHSADCGPPPASHTATIYADMVFLCRDHVMTSLNATDYGVIYLTPNQMADFTDEEAVIRWDMSTLQTSQRDWVDLWITPYDGNLQLPIDEAPDLQGPPKRAVHIRMIQTGPDNTGVFLGVNVFRDHAQEKIPYLTDESYTTFLEPSPARRDTFEVRISRTHVWVGMPAYGKVWVDAPIADLGWSQGVVQFGHHSYNPTKCEGTCAPNTWHWDNVQIAPAVPFTIIRAEQRMLDSAQPTPITFSQPAPANAYVRFAGYGDNIEISFDGGAAWQAAEKQAQIQNDSVHFRSYWMTIPEGTQAVQFRGQANTHHGWHIRDVSIWSAPH